MYTLYRDEDMQSVASLMSMGKTDIGNLDDIEDEESDLNISAKFAEITNQMSQLETNQNMGNPFGGPDLDVDDDFAHSGILSFFPLLFLFFIHCLSL